jgi:hypothetical protein
MPAKKVVIFLFIVSILVTVGLLLVNECAYGGGMGAAYQSCDCLGFEWELYDRTAADGPRKTLCMGIVRFKECYQYMGGPTVECDRGSRLTIETDKQVYEVGEEITITIVNDLSSSISYYGFCSLYLCQYVESDWLCEMKECHSSTVVLETGNSRETKTQAQDRFGAKLKYRLDYQIASEGTLYTAHSNEFTIEQKSVTDAGYRVYVRQLIPGEAWLEDG